MEQKIISKTNDQCISLIKEKNLDFYLIIPNNEQLTILLGLFPEANDDFIKNLPKENDKAIVVPIINNQTLTNVNNLDPTSVNYLNSVLSYLINKTYDILKQNNLKVNNKVLLNNNETIQTFIQKYLEKYPDRVDTYNLLKKEEPKSQTLTDSQIVNNDISPKKLTLKKENKDHEPGFVSYVLLGVLVAVITLVFLYLIL